MSRLQDFRLDIQGLRAVAIVAVVLYHALGNRVPGGFVGVDVFFVISGFLITRILMREIEAGQFSIASFYVRRVRRLFPALFTMLAAVLVAGVVLLPSPQLMQLGQSVSWTAFFAANVYQYRTLDYFAEEAALRPLLHCWSLGVEEQFYIAYPVFLAFISRLPRRWLKLALWIGVLCSLALSCALVDVSPKAAFYLPYSRGYELGIGTLVAVGAIPRVRHERVADVLSLTGLVMIFAAFACIDHTTPYPGLAGLLPCLGTALIIHAGSGRETAGGRFLGAPPLQFFGAISYSLYLWHWPILVFARYVVLGELGINAIAVSLALSLAIACLSYRLIERPMLRWHISKGRIAAEGVGVALAMALCGAAFVRLDGLPQRFDQRSLAMFAAAGDFMSRRPQCHYHFDRPIDYPHTCVFGAPDVPPTVAVWSDSLGAELSVALGERLGNEGRAVRELTASSCPPSLGFSPWQQPGCAEHNRAVLSALIAEKGITTVVLVAYYDGYANDRLRLLAGIRAAALRLHAAGKRVVLVYPIPVPQFDVPKALGMIVWHGGDPSSWGPAPNSGDAGGVVTPFLDRLAKEVRAGTIVPQETLCSRTRCKTVGPDGAVLYFDDHHLSLAGARLLLANSTVREILGPAFGQKS